MRRPSRNLRPLLATLRKQAPLWANVARAYRDLGQAGQARQAAAKALAIDSTFHGAREILGDAYFLDGGAGEGARELASRRGDNA